MEASHIVSSFHQKKRLILTDWRKRLKDKVLVLLNRNQIESTLTSVLSHQGRGKGEKSAEFSKESRLEDYQKFALEYFEFLATLNKPGMKMVTEKW
jgi:hypothetical protein